jgi:hypothetical protein
MELSAGPDIMPTVPMTSLDKSYLNAKFDYEVLKNAVTALEQLMDADGGHGSASLISVGRSATAAAVEIWDRRGVCGGLSEGK